MINFIKKIFYIFKQGVAAFLLLFSYGSYADTYEIGAVVTAGFVTPEFSFDDITTAVSPPGGNCHGGTPTYTCYSFKSQLKAMDYERIPGTSMYGIPLIKVNGTNSQNELYLVFVEGSMQVVLHYDGYEQERTISLSPEYPPDVAMRNQFSYNQTRTPYGRQYAKNMKYRIYSTGRIAPGEYAVFSKNQNLMDIVNFYSDADSYNNTGGGNWNINYSQRRVARFLVRPACNINTPSVVEWTNMAIKPVQGTSYGTKSTTLTYSCETGLNAYAVTSKVSLGTTDSNKKKLFLNTAESGPYITGSLKNSPPGCNGSDFLFDGENSFTGNNTGSVTMQWDLCSDGRPEAGKAYSGAIDVFVLSK